MSWVSISATPKRMDETNNSLYVVDDEIVIRKDLFCPKLPALSSSTPVPSANRNVKQTSEGDVPLLEEDSLLSVNESGVEKENARPVITKRQVQSLGQTSKRPLVARKSTDLRRLKTAEERMEAIVNSPMIEVRRKNSLAARLSRSMIEMGSDSDILNETADLMLTSTSKEEIDTINSCLESFHDLLSASETTETPEVTSSVTAPIDEPTKFLSPGKVASRRSSLKSPKKVVTPETARVKSPAVKMTSPTLEKDVVKTPKESQVTQPDSRITQCQVNLFVVCNQLKEIVWDWEDVLKEEKTIPDKAMGDIRVAKGMAELLMKKKLPFFGRLVRVSLGEEVSDDGTPPPSLEDLKGYWDLVEPEVKKVIEAFHRLSAWRDAQWIDGSRVNTPMPPRVTAPKAKTRQIPVFVQRKPVQSSFASFRAGLKRKVTTESAQPQVSESHSDDSGTDKSKKVETTPVPLPRRGHSQRVSSQGSNTSKSVSYVSHSADITGTPDQDMNPSRRFRKTPRRTAPVVAFTPSPQLAETVQRPPVRPPTPGIRFALDPETPQSKRGMSEESEDNPSPVKKTTRVGFKSPASPVKKSTIAFATPTGTEEVHRNIRPGTPFVVAPQTMTPTCSPVDPSAKKRRGRPSKAATPSHNMVLFSEEETDNDVQLVSSKRSRGRPSKSATPSHKMVLFSEEKTNGDVQPVSLEEEVTVLQPASAKRSRGRPSKASKVDLISFEDDNELVLKPSKTATPARKSVPNLISFDDIEEKTEKSVSSRKRVRSPSPQLLATPAAKRSRGSTAVDLAPSSVPAQRKEPLSNRRRAVTSAKRSQAANKSSLHPTSPSTHV